MVFLNRRKPHFYGQMVLLEIPVPVIKYGPVSIPYLGGIYLRYIPVFILKRLIDKEEHPYLWTYCHPYDFDAEEPFF